MDMKEVKKLIDELKDKGRDEKYKVKQGAQGGRHPVREDTTWLLSAIVFAVNPNTTVELGTAYGFSTLFLAIPNQGKIWTVEFDKSAAYKAREHFDRAGLTENEVEVYHGDAAEFLRNWKNGEIDLIFFDADKSRYGEWYNLAKKHFHPGTLIVADNVLFKGEGIDCREEVKDFVEAVQKDCAPCTILETASGLLLARYFPDPDLIPWDLPKDAKVAVD